MARPQIAVEGYELQVWRVAARLRASCIVVEGREAKNPLQQNPVYTKMIRIVSDLLLLIGNELLCTIKDGEYLDWLNDVCFLRRRYKLRVLT
jgi:hypothetical protein